jgi:hypothetical protein
MRSRPSDHCLLSGGGCVVAEALNPLMVSLIESVVRFVRFGSATAKPTGKHIAVNTCSLYPALPGTIYLSLTLANSEQAYRPRGMRNMGSLSTIS